MLGTITNTTDISRTHRSRKHLSTLEKYHTYNICKDNLQLYDTNIHKLYVVFKAL
jgi:hypothetical protein